MHDGEQLVLKDIEYVPGLYKIFDEILVNAADNKVRDLKMDKLEVTIDPVRPSRSSTSLISNTWRQHLEEPYWALQTQRGNLQQD